MVAIFALVALGRYRIVAMLCAMASLAVALARMAHCAATITEPGVALLVWIAFGTVLAVFLFVPPLVGELVRTRSQLRVVRLPTGATGI